MAKDKLEAIVKVDPKELIERRLKVLREQELPQAVATVNAIQGAIQLCEQLLLQLNGKEEKHPILEKPTLKTSAPTWERS